MKKQEQLLPKEMKLISKGKVWECYVLPNFSNLMLKVATDNISTHNIVHKSQIPMKGQVLVAMSIMFAEELFHDIGIEHHLVAYGEEVMSYIEPSLFSDDVKKYHDFIRRSMIIKKLDMIPYEFIFRGNMTGMPSLIPTIFTPTDKSETDDSVNSAKIKRLYLEAVEISIKVYRAAREFTRLFGIDIIDTKFKLGLDEDGNIFMADEWLTPDSSRYVYFSDIIEGQNPKWLDKQVARDWVEKYWEGNTGGKKCPVEFPADVIGEFTETYTSLFERLYGQNIDDF